MLEWVVALSVEEPPIVADTSYNHQNFTDAWLNII